MPWQVHPSVRIFRGLDWGYWPDPAYCVWVAQSGSLVVAFKEKLWYRTIAATVAREIVEESDGLRVAATYADPTLGIRTGADVRTIRDVFEEHGVPLDLSVNNRELFAHAIHTALAERRLKIYVNGHRGCPYLARTLPLMRYDPKHPLRMADHPEDHAVVALAYVLISSGVADRRTPTRDPLPRWMRPPTPAYVGR